MSKRTLLAAGLLLPIAGALAISAQDRPASAPDPAAEARLTLATEGCEIASKLYAEGRVDADKLMAWSGRLADAEREAGGDAADAAQGHLDRMRKIEQMARALREAGRGTNLEILDARYAVSEAEALLAKAKPPQGR